MAGVLKAALEKYAFTVTWLNADVIRATNNDWDFTYEGRVRQAKRMFVLADKSLSNMVIADFVAPTEELREIFDADITIWLDTIHESRYEDTNQLFVPPVNYTFRFTEKDSIANVETILNTYPELK
jgi:adenylylsulfate kinase